jgi:crotonobetainyl-CoA:carnitine CoA-transferase CaiB-like acyl-CoA transferase
MTMTPPSLSLEGIRVLDLSRVLAGPFCGMLLSDLGADVIKIEDTGSGDESRTWPPHKDGESAAFLVINRNKRDMTLDLKAPEGAAILKRMVATADVLIENFRTGTMESFGLGYDVLSAINPRLVYCSISGYGQDGPYRDVKAYDLLIQGEGGIIATTGYPDKPAKAGISISDIAAGMYAALGIVLALYQREKTGRGQQVDISMLESIVAWLGYFPHHYWHRGEEAARVGMRHHYVTPYGPYLARDGEYVNLAVATVQDWEVFCRQVLERPDLLEDSRFATVEARRENRALLEQTIEGLISERDHTEWLERLKKAELPHGIVRGIAKVLAHPQLVARKFLCEVDSPVGRVPVLGNPLRLSQSPVRFDPIPALGEQTATILARLGYDDGQIAQLQREKVI